MDKEGRTLLNRLYAESDHDLNKRGALIFFCADFEIFLKEALSWMEPVVAQDGGKTGELLFLYGRLLALNGEKQEGLKMMEKAQGMVQEDQGRLKMSKEIVKLRRELGKG